MYLEKKCDNIRVIININMNIFRKITGVTFGVISVLALWLLDAAPNYVNSQGYLLSADSIFNKIPIWLPALFIIGIWAILSYYLWKYTEKKYDIPVYNFSLVGYLLASLTSVYIIADQALQRKFVLLLTIVIISFLYGFVKKEKGYSIHQMKSYRRVAMMLWTFVVYAISSLFFVINIFFQGIPFWVLAIILSLLLTSHMFYVWKMYIDITAKTSVFWLVIISIFMFEIIWVVQLLPFAYSVLGLFVAWAWYIIQLLLRFHFSKTGISWKKQQTFLLTNLGIFVMLLLLSQWR